jgi:hypothetical protein
MRSDQAIQPTASPRRYVSDVDARASREYWSHHAVIRVYDEAGNVIHAHEYAGEFKEP